MSTIEVIWLLVSFVVAGGFASWLLVHLLVVESRQRAVDSPTALSAASRAPMRHWWASSRLFLGILIGGGAYGASLFDNVSGTPRLLDVTGMFCLLVLQVVAIGRLWALTQSLVSKQSHQR